MIRRTDADLYEMTQPCYTCELGTCMCMGMHGCDKYASRECNQKCIEACSDDLDCCQCGCECQSPSECFGKSIDRDHDCRCKEVQEEFDDIY